MTDAELAALDSEQPPQDGVTPDPGQDDTSIADGGDRSSGNTKPQMSADAAQRVDAAIAGVLKQIGPSDGEEDDEPTPGTNPAVLVQSKPNKNADLTPELLSAAKALGIDEPSVSRLLSADRDGTLRLLGATSGPAIPTLDELLQAAGQDDPSVGTDPTTTAKQGQEPPTARKPQPAPTQTTSQAAPAGGAPSPDYERIDALARERYGIPDRDALIRQVTAAVFDEKLAAGMVDSLMAPAIAMGRERILSEMRAHQQSVLGQVSDVIRAMPPAVQAILGNGDFSRLTREQKTEVASLLGTAEKALIGAARLSKPISIGDAMRMAMGQHPKLKQYVGGGGAQAARKSADADPPARRFTRTMRPSMSHGPTSSKSELDAFGQSHAAALERLGINPADLDGDDDLDE